LLRKRKSWFSFLSPSMSPDACFSRCFSQNLRPLPQHRSRPSFALFLFRRGENCQCRFLNWRRETKESGARDQSRKRVWCQLSPRKKELRKELLRLRRAFSSSVFFPGARRQTTTQSLRDHTEYSFDLSAETTARTKSKARGERRERLSVQ